MGHLGQKTAFCLIGFLGGLVRCQQRLSVSLFLLFLLLYAVGSQDDFYRNSVPALRQYDMDAHPSVTPVIVPSEFPCINRFPGTNPLPYGINRELCCEFIPLIFMDQFHVR